jgi:hypothetical protein
MRRKNDDYDENERKYGEYLGYIVVQFSLPSSASNSLDKAVIANAKISVQPEWHRAVHQGPVPCQK